MSGESLIARATSRGWAAAQAAAEEAFCVHDGELLLHGLLDVLADQLGHYPNADELRGASELFDGLARDLRKMAEPERRAR